MISVRRVALDPLGAGVPGRDAAVGVEHEDRVVDDAVDEQAKVLGLALALALHGPAGRALQARSVTLHHVTVG